MGTTQILGRIVWGKSPRWTFIRAGVLAFVAFITFKFILLPIKISGCSMEPAYHNGSVNMVNALRYRILLPKRGDVVAIELAGRRVLLLKRIIGMPGDRVAFVNGAVLISGEKLPEPYLKKKCDWNRAEVLVGPDEYFVVGDNRQMPIEYHTFGRVKRTKIVGTPLW